MKQMNYLGKNFPQIIDIHARAEQEKELDEIAQGKKSKLEVLRPWWDNLKAQIDKVSPENALPNEQKVCPNCGKPMKIKSGRYGPFWACTGYPECKTIESIKKKS